ncbi:MAG: hypothetical protein JWQ02_751 [Capsulimonas sp.]|jgi:hypothetical protein|nr:hypothetical protein [Capsulimonas sp.]
MVTQSPPAPADVQRSVTIGSLRLESDGDFLYAAQPRYDTQRRRVGPVLTGLALSHFLLSMGVPLLAHHLSTAEREQMLMAMFDARCFWIPAGYFALCFLIQSIYVHWLHADRFSLIRNPQTFRTQRGYMHTLPIDARLSITSRLLLLRRVYVVWITIPGANGAKDRTFGLANFRARADAERATAAIEGFLRAG